jgi:acyl-ACP thioesterase
MNNIRKDDYYIHSFDVDFTSKVSLCTVCNLFQESAWRHATEHKLGYHDLIKSNKAWVLSSIKINIKELPAWKDEISIYTWARTTDKLFAYRDFEVYRNGSGKSAIKASSSWLIIDIQSKRPQKMEAYADLMPLLKDKHAINKALEKIPAVEEVHDSYKKTTAYSDLDVNHHVNNVKYVEWILDLFTLEYQKNHIIRDFEINYRNEVGYNEVVKLEGQRNNTPESFLVQGIHNSSDKSAFRAIINWNSI